MALKESSDELNDPVAVSTAEVPAPKRRTAGDYVALAIATCGVGYLPIAPGTLGALVGAAAYLAIWSSARGPLENLYPLQPALMMLIIFAVTMVGIWAATRTEKVLQRKDPSIVVIDEVSGQMIALLSGFFGIHTWWSILSAFILFRLFDIWKPYPIRRLEGLPSGLGIMADDVLAGVYALIANSVLISVYLLLFARG